MVIDRKKSILYQAMTVHCTPQLYTDKKFLKFLWGFESVQSKPLILELAKQNIEVLNTKRFVSEVTHLYL